MQRMRGVILPNHFRIQAIIMANQQHMTDAELQTFAQYGNPPTKPQYFKVEFLEKEVQ